MAKAISLFSSELFKFVKSLVDVSDKSVTSPCAESPLYPGPILALRDLRWGHCNFELFHMTVLTFLFSFHVQLLVVSPFCISEAPLHLKVFTGAAKHHWRRAAHTKPCKVHYTLQWRPLIILPLLEDRQICIGIVNTGVNLHAESYVAAIHSGIDFDITIVVLLLMFLPGGVSSPFNRLCISAASARNQIHWLATQMVKKLCLNPFLLFSYWFLSW